MCNRAVSEHTKLPYTYLSSALLCHSAPFTPVKGRSSLCFFLKPCPSKLVPLVNFKQERTVKLLLPCPKLFSYSFFPLCQGWCFTSGNLDQGQKPDRRRSYSNIKASPPWLGRTHLISSWPLVCGPDRRALERQRLAALVGQQAPFSFGSLGSFALPLLTSVSEQWSRDDESQLHSKNIFGGLTSFSQGWSHTSSFIQQSTNQSQICLLEYQASVFSPCHPLAI